MKVLKKYHSSSHFPIAQVWIIPKCLLLIQSWLSCYVVPTLWWFHIVTLIFLSCLASALQQSKIRGCLWRKVAKKGTFLEATLLLINIWWCFKQFYHFQHHIWNVSFQHCQQKFLTAVKHATNSPICLYLRVDARYLALYLHFHDFFSDARSIFRKKNILHTCSSWPKYPWDILLNSKSVNASIVSKVIKAKAHPLGLV